MTGILRVHRQVALAMVAVLVAAASVASLAESYRGLYLWAGHHGLSGLWMAMFPLQVDTFLVVGELALFVALVDRWPVRSRVGAWVVTAAGLAVSVAGNVGHIAGHSATNRATAAIPPLAAAAALAVGLGVLKRVVSGHHDGPVARVATVVATPLASGHPGGQAPEVASVVTPVAIPSANGHRRGQARQVATRSAADTEAAALAALATDPAMTHKQLATAIGTSERTARRVRARLASTT